MESESITIHATPSDIQLPMLHLREMLFANQVEEEIIKSCETALHELLTKIIECEDCSKEQQLITVNIAYNKSGVYIETQYEGTPVEFGSITLEESMKEEQPENEPLFAEELDQEEIKQEFLTPKNLIQEDLDEVWYEVEMGKNIWQLVKYI